MALEDITNKVTDKLGQLGANTIGGALGIASHPIDRLKANVTAWLKTAKFEVNIFPPRGMNASSNVLSALTLACHTAEGMGAQTFGTTDVRRGEALLRRLPNDVIYPDLSLGFHNVLQRDNLVVYKFFSEWLSLVNIGGLGGGFGYADDYVGKLEITQMGDDGARVHTYHIDNFYPTSVSVAGLNGASSDDLHTVEVRGVQYPNND
jgi:hypothetical protein